MLGLSARKKLRSNLEIDKVVLNRRAATEPGLATPCHPIHHSEFCERFPEPEDRRNDGLLCQL